MLSFFLRWLITAVSLLITLGLAREVADWIDPLDSPLLKAVGKEIFALMT